MAAWDLLTVIPKSLDYKLASHSSTSWTSMLEIPITIKGWLKLVPGLPGKPFKPFFNLFLCKNLFFPSFCEKPFLAFFSLWSLKLPQNDLFRAYICKKIPEGGPQAPTCGKESPAAPTTHAALGRIVVRGIASCHLVPHKKFSLKKNA